MHMVKQTYEKDGNVKSAEIVSLDDDGNETSFILTREALELDFRDAHRDMLKGVKNGMLNADGCMVALCYKFCRHPETRHRPTDLMSFHNLETWNMEKQKYLDAGGTITKIAGNGFTESMGIHLGSKMEGTIFKVTYYQVQIPKWGVDALSLLLPMVLTNVNISGPCTFIYAHVRHREKIHECAFCGVSDERLSVCKGCKLVGYCSRECQKMHWKKTHRCLCKRN